MSRRGSWRSGARAPSRGLTKGRLCFRNLTRGSRIRSLSSNPRRGPNPSAAEEAACRQRLSALGARFEERPPVSDPSGCAIPHPIMLSALGGGIGIQPEALLNCATAEALARFLTGTAAKIAKEELGLPLKSVGQASGYVCRPRNGTSNCRNTPSAMRSTSQVSPCRTEP